MVLMLQADYVYSTWMNCETFLAHRKILPTQLEMTTHPVLQSHNHSTVGENFIYQ